MRIYDFPSSIRKCSNREESRSSREPTQLRSGSTEEKTSMIQVICQWLCVINILFSMLLLLYRDVNGSPAKEPLGFEGIVSTLIAVAMLTAMQWGAGAFSNLLGGHP
jgi:hypothetical protein